MNLEITKFKFDCENVLHKMCEKYAPHVIKAPQQLNALNSLILILNYFESRKSHYYCRNILLSKLFLLTTGKMAVQSTIISV